MSQVYKVLTSSGPIPPTIPTSFVTDDGTAIPALNILNVLGDDTIENDTNGLFTRADPNGGNNVQVLLSNRISVASTTIDDIPTTVNLMTMTNDTSVTFRVLISVLKATVTAGTAGGELVGIARATGGVATVVGTNDTFDEADNGGPPLNGFDLTAIDWDVISDGGLNLQMQFTGVAATTLNWRFLFEYTQAP